MRSCVFLFLALAVTLFVICIAERSFSEDDCDDDFDYSQSDPPAVGQDGNFLNCLGLGDTASKAVDRWFSSSSLRVNFRYGSRMKLGTIVFQHNDKEVVGELDFDIRRRTVVIVHGFKTKGVDGWMQRLQDAYLTWGDVNVIIADWSKDSNTWNYYKAAVNTRTVGDQMANVLENFADETRHRFFPDTSKWGDIHCVGHSLGAHICGYMAKQLKARNTPWRVGRITGLDPAQPCFKSSPQSLFLHKLDADFVDVIHTNGRAMSKLGLGLSNPIGHIDFYPNGGKVQPGCHQPSKKLFGIIPTSARFWKNSVCDHKRSHYYLVESLYSDVTKNCTMWGYSWDRSIDSVPEILDKQARNEAGCAEMGINAEKYKGKCEGTLFVLTSSIPPYCEVSYQQRIDIMNHLKKYQ